MRRGRVFAGLMLALAVVLAWGPVSAQDGGLSDEELAQLDRIFAARQQLETYDTYVETATGNTTQSVVITVGDQVVEVSQTGSWERMQTVVQTEAGRNVNATIRASAEGTNDPPYTVVAEVRFVDGVLYVNAAYEEPSADLPTLPEGWIAVEDLDAFLGDYPALDMLQLDTIDDDTPSQLLEDQDRFRRAASTVTAGPVTTDDGTTAEEIAAIVAGEGLSTVTDEAIEDETQQGLFSDLTDTSQAVLAVVVDSDNNPLRVRSEVLLAAEDVDAAAISPDDFPPGTLISFSFESVDIASYSAVNEPIEPVEAPTVSAAPVEMPTEPVAPVEMPTEPVG